MIRIFGSPPTRELVVEIVGEPGKWMTPAALVDLQDACRTVVVACLAGQQLDYGLFAGVGDAWDRSVRPADRREGVASRSPDPYRTAPLPILRRPRSPRPGRSTRSAPSCEGCLGQFPPWDRATPLPASLRET
ncbi:hypothetical protein CVN68_11780 [Sphingomonas psychrotolerans]|uniref:Uncharacterized protein n=1 Tax=Sphingomonas psychrotolerans TaxID=1327635 RepID=A0A2K8MFA6_9SPHN|nr:hypothetical protein CVN68_11780 [Sphingomonas psychrotolerans]